MVTNRTEVNAHAIARHGGTLLEDVTLFDVYAGEGIPAGERDSFHHRADDVAVIDALPVAVGMMLMVGWSASAFRLLSMATEPALSTCIGQATRPGS